jgi:hypothetical protein
VVRAGTHPHQRRQVGVIQHQPVVHRSDTGRGVTAERVGEPLRLGRVNADQAERPAEFPQVSGVRCGDDQCTVSRQEAVDLGRVARPEDAQHQSGRVRRERKALPDVRRESRRSRMCPGGTSQRRDGQVDAQSGPAGECVQYPGQVVAGPAGQVHREPVRGSVALRRQRLECRGQRPVVPAAEEAFARCHHRDGVTGAGPGPACAQVDVAVAGDIEAVLATAGELAAGQVHQAAADRAAHKGDSRCQCRVVRIHRSVPSSRKK